jgi:hypothetical protein
MERLILDIVSGATLLALVGYLLHSIYTGYREFKKDAYRRFEEIERMKLDKKQCEEFREYERREIDSHKDRYHG